MIRRSFAFTLPKLPFGTSELQPIIDHTTISYHWGKHHQAYVMNLNNALLHPSPVHLAENIINKVDSALGSASPSMLKEKMQIPLEQSAHAPGSQPNPGIDEKASSKADEAIHKAKETIQEKSTEQWGSLKDKISDAMPDIGKIKDKVKDSVPDMDQLKNKVKDGMDVSKLKDKISDFGHSIKDKIQHATQTGENTHDSDKGQYNQQVEANQESQADLTLLEIVQNRAQQSVALRNNGGGHYNHCLFWLCLGTGKEAPTGRLLQDLNKSFGDLDSFKKDFTKKSVELFGSGYA